MHVTVAIPVRNGGPLLVEVLDAVVAQVLPDGVTCELMICDSGSSDGSRAVARAHGAEVLTIEPASYSHGGTRNLLLERSRGELVALLTQDAVPADPAWLAKLIGGFDRATNVGLVFGPYLPRPDASPMVRRELEAWFGALAPDGRPRADRLAAEERSLPASALYGARAFFTDANGCVSRAAWEAVPFRSVAYAEDHALALDMLRAGYAKVFVPDAAVVHSHEYSNWGWLRRSFDEARAVREIYGVEDPGELRRLLQGVRGAVAADLRYGRTPHARAPAGAGSLPAPGTAAPRLPAPLLRSLRHHCARATGTALGARADRLPRALVRRLSLERRA